MPTTTSNEREGGAEGSDTVRGKVSQEFTWFVKTGIVSVALSAHN